LLKGLKLNEIQVRKDVPIKEAAAELIDNFYPGEGIEKIENIMSHLKIGGFNKLPQGIKRDFIEEIIESYFYNYSDNIRNFVQKGLGQILSINVIDAASIGETKQRAKGGEKDVMERMMREGSK